MSDAIAALGETGEEAGQLSLPDSVAGQEQSTQETQDDFWGRVESGGDFAKEQVTTRDAKISELSNRVKTMEPIEQLLGFTGGNAEELLALANFGTRVQQNPALMQVVQNALETGRVDLPQQANSNGVEEEEVWIDPDTKRELLKRDDAIATLQAQLAQLTQVAQAADVRSQEAYIERNIQEVLKDFAAVPEAMKEATEAVTTSYRQAMRKAETDPQQAELVRKLAGPEGANIFKTVTNDIWRKHAARFVAAQNAQAAEANGALGKSTDGPNTSTARPGNPQLPPIPKGRVTDKYVEEVARRAAANLGVDVDRL